MQDRPLPPGERCADCPVRRLALFQPLGREELAAIQKVRGPDRVVQQGDAILGGGRPERGPYTLFAGWAAGVRMLGDGGRQILTIYLPGDFLDFGHLDASDGAHEIVAITPVRLCSFRREELLREFEAHPSLLVSLNRLLRKEEALLVERVTDLGRRSARDRVGRFLLELFDRMRGRNATNGESCALPLTQQHIGDALGLSTEHVNRVLRQLREDQLATVADRVLTIHDRTRLARLVGRPAGEREMKPLL